MNNEIQKFDFKGAPLRTLTDKAEEPWFVAKDVCDILGTDTRDLHKILESDEITNVDSIHIAQNGGKAPLIISEPGLYRLVMKSRKPEAKEFQRWVTHEVLPSIRKHGGYMAGQERMTPEQMALASMRWLQSKVDEQAKQLKAQEGKVLFANAVENREDVHPCGRFREDPEKQRHRHRPTAPVRLAPRAWMAHQGQGLQLEHAHTEGDGPSPVRGQGDDHQPLGRAHHDQQDAEDDRQGADVLHQPVPQADVGSGRVMDKNMQRAMLSAFDDLRNRLITATQPKTSVDLIDSTFAMSSIGGRGLEQLREAAAAAAVLGQMEAVCRFLLEILYPAGVGEGVDDLLAAESDEIDSLREFPNLGILRGLLDSRGDAGSAGDVSSRLFECLSLCEHDSSPNCSARTSEMRDDTEFRRGPGGSPNAVRHHTRKGGA